MQRAIRSHLEGAVDKTNSSADETCSARVSRAGPRISLSARKEDRQDPPDATVPRRARIALISKSTGGRDGAEVRQV